MEEDIKSEDIRRFWHAGEKHLEIFLAVIAGTSFDKIEKDLNLRPFTLTRVTQNPIFKKQMAEYLAMTLDNFTTEQIQDFPEIYRKIKALVYQKLNDVSADCIFKEFLKLIPKEERKELITEVVKIKKKVLKKGIESGQISQERAVELKRIFGYDPKPTESTTENPRLDKPEGAENE